jgi:hypothetical protein
MIEPPPLEVQDRPELNNARHIALVLGRSEHALGIRDAKALPLSARIENALQGAMQAPELVDEDTFELLHLLTAGRGTFSSPISP